jgi:hypothetical protein
MGPAAELDSCWHHQTAVATSERSRAPSNRGARTLRTVWPTPLRRGPLGKRMALVSMLTLGLRPARASADAAGRMALKGLDALLAWRYTDEAVRRMLASPVVDRAVGHALSGPLVDAVARDIARYAVLERVADELLAGDALDRALARAEAADLPQRLVDRLLADGAVDRIADRLLDGPELEGLSQRVIESHLLETIVERLLESEELWLLVAEIAESPPVTAAIGRQGVGFAEQVAGAVRVRSERADAGLERVARRLLGRRTPPAGGAVDSGAR